MNEPCWACHPDPLPGDTARWRPGVDSAINVPLCLEHARKLAPWRHCTCCSARDCATNEEATAMIRRNHPGVVI